MQLGVVGLGRMGTEIARRLLRHGHDCVVFNRNLEKVHGLEREGAIAAHSLTELMQLLTKPRIVWVMLPAGEPTEQMIATLAETLGLGDIIIDGGNSYYKDDVRRARQLNTRGMHYVDVGISSGIYGLERGYCLTVGGDAETVCYLEPIFNSLVADRREHAPTPESETQNTQVKLGYLHCGPNGAGHFVKMVHDGVQCALMQVYAEGLSILHHAYAETLAEEHRYCLNVAEIAKLWCSSMIHSGLLVRCAIALAENPTLLDDFEPVPDVVAEGAVMAALEAAIPAEVLSAALYTRLRARPELTFAEKLRLAMQARCRA